ncbi:prosaposin-like [Porites lutea]|uniref:prosaposin-like n=1 Tax=Porites lutea TaxID=51062 RepID=UPI003CC57D8E
MAPTLAVFVLLVASVAATPLGQSKCSWGPSYWCQSYKQAVECKALEHCRSKVWAVKDDTACEICELVIPQIKEFLSQNATQEEVISVLEKTCDDLGPELSGMCKSLVDQYEPVIMKNLLALMADPQQACTALGLCQSKQKKVIAAKLIMSTLPLAKNFLSSKPKKAILKSKPYKASPLCVLCEFVMTELKTLLSENATQEEIKEALEEVCSLLPSTIQSECKQFVEQYEQAIIEILVQELDPSMVCTALNLCASKKHQKAMEKPVALAVGSNETCEICETVMTYLKNALADNATKEEILSLMKAVCNYLPSQIASECSAIVSEYGEAILDLIADSDPHALCKEIGLCDSAVVKKKGGDFCFLGASFWCASKQNAINCNALKHCTEHVWN